MVPDSSTLWTNRLLCPREFPGNNIGVHCLALCRGSSWPRDQTHVSCSSCIAGRFFTTEPPDKRLCVLVFCLVLWFYMASWSIILIIMHYVVSTFIFFSNLNLRFVWCWIRKVQMLLCQPSIITVLNHELIVPEKLEIKALDLYVQSKLEFWPKSSLQTICWSLFCDCIYIHIDSQAHIPSSSHPISTCFPIPNNWISVCMSLSHTHIHKIH